MSRAGRVVRRALPFAALVGLGLCMLPSCGVGYVVRSGYYEMELLASRRPVDEVLAAHTLSAAQEQRLRLIQEVKAYGARLGLSATDNYDTVAMGWDRTIWNLTACAPLSFTPRTWWFPIVGEMPYLGYFVEDDAREMEARMKDDGLDVYVRTAGAYSTLGWFRDPVLPDMLGWSEPDLTATVFHELAHATLWIPGSAMFNESFAEVVGVASMHTYLIDTRGADSVEYAEVMQQEADERAFTALLHQLCAELDAVYTDASLDDATRLQRKAALYASIPSRIAASPIVNKAGYQRWAERSEWNNARLIQFKTYNAADDDFAAMVARRTGADGRVDVRGFIDDLRGALHPAGQGWAPDPFVALHAAAVRAP